MNDQKIQMRLVWVRLYEQTEDAGYVCRRCGITRPTLRKWYRRYQKFGVDGLQDQSKKPNNSPDRKIFDQEESGFLIYEQK
jgi:transposase-like protein